LIYDLQLSWGLIFAIPLLSQDLQPLGNVHQGDLPPSRRLRALELAARG